MSEIIHDLVVTVSSNNINIRDSYTITKKEEMVEILYSIQHNHPNCQTFKRSYKQLVAEWKTHSRLYKWGLFKSHTKDVDLNYPVKWYVQLIYNILGI